MFMVQACNVKNLFHALLSRTVLQVYHILLSPLFTASFHVKIGRPYLSLHYCRALRFNYALVSLEGSTGYIETISTVVEQAFLNCCYPQALAYNVYHCVVLAPFLYHHKSMHCLLVGSRPTCYTIQHCTPNCHSIDLNICSGDCIHPPLILWLAILSSSISPSMPKKQKISFLVTIRSYRLVRSFIYGGWLGLMGFLR